jgi:hypothetical protein
MGYARLLPEEVAVWLLNEASEAFSRGDTFVTPAELVGVANEVPESAAAFEALSGAIGVRSDRSSDSLLQLELPGLDKLSPDKFNKLVGESDIELTRLRTAFGRLVDASRSSDLAGLVAELNYETSELTLADKYQSFRARVTRLGGVIATTAAAIGASVGATSADLATTLAASAGGVAAAGLCECLRLRAEHGLEQRRNPFYLLWSLGSHGGQRVHAAPPPKHRAQQRSAAPIERKEDGYFHWLAPPTCGVQFLFVKRQTTEANLNVSGKMA